MFHLLNQLIPSTDEMEKQGIRQLWPTEEYNEMRTQLGGPLSLKLTRLLPPVGPLTVYCLYGLYLWLSKCS